MEIILTFIISGITFYVGYTFGKKEVKPIKEETKENEEQKRIEASFQKLFDYNESIATRGYGNER